MLKVRKSVAFFHSNTCGARKPGGQAAILPGKWKSPPGAASPYSPQMSRVKRD